MAADNHYRVLEVNLPPLVSLGAPNPPPISRLEDNLLVEILIRSFPNPKPAFRCKSVCKHWSSLISSPYFNRRFVSHHQIMSLRHHQPPMPENPYELELAILSFLPPMPNRAGYVLKVLDCFQDLVLCGFWDPDHGFMDVDRKNGELSRSYLICNPFTKQWIALPLAPKKPESVCILVATRLVCEPRITKNLDLGDDQAFVHHEYRFRVVRMYQDFDAEFYKLDVFCSESGEWIRQGDHVRGTATNIIWGMRDARSCNGELFWMCSENGMVVLVNPFCLDMPPTLIDTSSLFAVDEWVTLSSQGGAVHVITQHLETDHFRVISWRLKQDRKSWRKQCEWIVDSVRCCSSENDFGFKPFLHPNNPEIIFFRCIGCRNTLFSCNSRKEEVELFAELEEEDDYNILVMVFEPRFSCWPTPIPRYKQLRGLYNGSHRFWVQGSSEAASNSTCYKLDAANRKLKELAAENKVLEAAVREERDECEKKLLEKDKLLIAAQEKIQGLENALRKEREKSLGRSRNKP